MNPINHGSVLIIRTDRLGDVVLTLPMALAIKQALPKSKVTFLVREYTRSIVERASGVDEVLVVEDPFRLIGLIRLIRRTKPNVVFLPSPRFQLAVATFLAHVPVRISTGYRWYSFLFNQKVFEHRKTAEHHEAEYNLRMLAKIGIEADLNLTAEIVLRAEEQMKAEEWLRKHLGGASAPFVVLHTVSGGSAHGWPSERFVELGRILRERLNCEIVLTGTESDRQHLAIEGQQLHAQLFVGNSLPELAALLARAMAVVCVSTGPGHLAAALGTPTVGLLALPKVISKERWGFRGKHVANISPPPISGCPDCKECSCMERIDAPRVAEQVIELVQAARG